MEVSVHIDVNRSGYTKFGGPNMTKNVSRLPLAIPLIFQWHRGYGDFKVTKRTKITTRRGKEKDQIRMLIDHKLHANDVDDVYVPSGKLT